jgi:hypothetical protein
VTVAAPVREVPVQSCQPLCAVTWSSVARRCGTWATGRRVSLLSRRAASSAVGPLTVR